MPLLMVKPELDGVQPWVARFVLFRKTCVRASSSPLSATGMQEFQTPERITERCCAPERSMKAARVMPMTMLINSVTNSTLPTRREGRGRAGSFMGGSVLLAHDNLRGLDALGVDRLTEDGAGAGPVQFDELGAGGVGHDELVPRV